jgi:hypothetical protein
MNFSKKDILRKTHYGLTIYSHILREFQPGETVLSLIGNECKPIKNPFTQSKNKTLKIKCVDWIFIFEDTENIEYKGDPFDFAELHYKITGDDILKKLNEGLNLNLDKTRGFYHNPHIVKHSEPTHEVLSLEELLQVPEFSYFSKPVINTKPDKVVNLIDVYLLIKGDSFKQSTNKLRAFTDKTEARKFKASNFDYVTFSGTFTKRENNSLLMHSELMTIDFDHVQDLDRLRTNLLRDDYFETELLFYSPSGDGLKWIVSIDIDNYAHTDYFEGIRGYIAYTYNLEIDKSGRDVARACFLAHDKNVFINPKYLKYVC